MLIFSVLQFSLFLLLILVGIFYEIGFRFSIE
jgi:hypothetical protein